MALTSSSAQKGFDQPGHVLAGSVARQLVGVKWHNEGMGQQRIGPYRGQDRILATLSTRGLCQQCVHGKGSAPVSCVCFFVFLSARTALLGSCTKHPPVQTGSHHPLLSYPLCLTTACQGAAAVCKTAAGHAELCPSAELLFLFFPYKHHLKTHHPATCVFTFFQERPSMWSRKCLHECSLK